MGSRLPGAPETRASSASGGSRLAGAPKQRATSTSAGLLLGQLPQKREHHPHQVDSRLAGTPKQASIINISWAASWTGAPKQPASSASSGLLLTQVRQRSQHHQHHLGCFSHRCANAASIIGIRWTVAWQVRASSASAGLLLAQASHKNQHHRHPAKSHLADFPQKAEIS